MNEELKRTVREMREVMRDDNAWEPLAGMSGGMAVGLGIVALESSGDHEPIPSIAQQQQQGIREVAPPRPTDTADLVEAGTMVGATLLGVVVATAVAARVRLMNRTRQT